jgi:hypothetical protein
MASVAGVAVALSACSPGAGQDSPPAPVDVTGSLVTLEDGRVTSLCFSYETDPSVEFVLSPYAEACAADIGWQGGDALTQIQVHGTNAFYGPKDFADEAAANGLGVASYAEIPVKAGMASRIDATDTLGFPLTVVLVPLPAGRFFLGDVALEAVWISAYTYNEELGRLLMAVVNSIEIAP